MFQTIRSASIVLIALLSLDTGTAWADLSTNAARRAERAYVSARSLYAAHPTQAESAVTMAQACSDWADFAASDAERVRIAREGIEAARSLIAREPNSAGAHYYLAVNLGQVVQTKKMGALKIVNEMETELLTALRLDQSLDHGGPDRALGLLYQGAPGWPISIGSRSKASQHFLHALELFPDYPDNRLCLIEAALKWDDRAKALEQSTLLKANWSAAKTLYTGEKWESSWNDWQKRWDSIQVQLGKPSKKEPI